MDFHGRKKLVAVHGQSQRSKLFARIRLDAPITAEATAHHLAQVAAPHLAEFAHVIR